jgi:hypothetical protein
MCYWYPCVFKVGVLVGERPAADPSELDLPVDRKTRSPCRGPCHLGVCAAFVA